MRGTHHRVGKGGGERGSVPLGAMGAGAAWAIPLRAGGERDVLPGGGGAGSLSAGWGCIGGSVYVWGPHTGPTERRCEGYG